MSFLKKVALAILGSKGVQDLFLEQLQKSENIRPIYKSALAHIVGQQNVPTMLVAASEAEVTEGGHMKKKSVVHQQAKVVTESKTAANLAVELAAMLIKTAK